MLLDRGLPTRASPFPCPWGGRTLWGCPGFLWPRVLHRDVPLSRGGCSSGLRGHHAAMSLDTQEMHLNWELLPFAEMFINTAPSIWFGCSGILLESLGRCQGQQLFSAQQHQAQGREVTMGPSLQASCLRSPSLSGNTPSAQQCPAPNPSSTAGSRLLKMPQPRCAARWDLLGKTQWECGR